RLARIESRLACFWEVVAGDATATSRDHAARVAAYLTKHRAAVTRHAARARSVILNLGEEQARELFGRVERGETTLTQASRLARPRRRARPGTGGPKEGPASRGGRRGRGAGGGGRGRDGGRRGGAGPRRPPHPGRRARRGGHGRPRGRARVDGAGAADAAPG